MSAAGRCWREVEGGVRVAVKVTPRARAASVGGLAASADGPRLRIAVTMPPEDGRASEAACAALAKALGLGRGAVSLRAGAASREKLLHVEADAAMVAARLDELASEDTK
jgi:uncharacterized protein